MIAIVKMKHFNVMISFMFGTIFHGEGSYQKKENIWSAFTFRWVTKKDVFVYVTLLRRKIGNRGIFGVPD